MKGSFRETPKKVWERISGIEPRRLWFELVETQKELVETQKELVETQKELVETQKELVETQNWNSQRKGRIHPFVAEALALITDSQISKSGLRISRENYVSPFTAFGSDKDTRHSYGPIYLEILEKFTTPRILEIGVGSINDFPYAGLAAGGSMKGFRSKFPTAIIVGIDIDPHSIEIIRADDFQGYVVDQTSDKSLIENKAKLAKHGPFDLIIDDGFHDPHANIRTLKAYFPLLSENGSYVIEDVHESLIDFWKVIGSRLPGDVDVVDLRSNRPDVDDNVLVIIRR